MRRRWSAGWRLAAAAVVLVSAACGGGGGGGGGSGPTDPPPPSGNAITFTATKAPTNNSLFLQQADPTNPNSLFLQVRVNQVTDLYGVAFDLLYPSAQLSYVGVTEKGFFKGRKTLQVALPTPGRLVIGHTNLSIREEAESGSGILMTLEFSPVAGGSGSFSFDNEQAYRPGSLPQTIEFIAGSVSVQ